jgi:hypothetical protein
VQEGSLEEEKKEKIGCRSAFGVSQFHFVEGDGSHILGIIKGKCQFHVVEMPSIDKINGAVNHFEIVGLCGVVGPPVRPLEIKPI